MKNCPNCGKEITKKRNKFCNQECSTEYQQKLFKEKNPDKECLECGKKISHHKKFCNNSCAAKYNNKGRVRTEESKNKMSEIAIANNFGDTFKNEDGSIKLNSRNTKRRFKLVCDDKDCYNEFKKTKYEVGLSKKHYCSVECKNKNHAGLQPNTGRGKKGKYKGFYCDSTYELVYIIYNLDNNIEFSRSQTKIPYFYEGKNRLYYPDFESNGKLIEIKGYHTEQVDVKLKATKEQGYTIDILYKDDLKYAFDYVKDNYEYEKLEDLYE